MTTTNYTYSSNSHRLTSLNSSAITYDNNGNTLTSAGISYTYNNANRLATSNNGTVATSYKYNALGQRVSKTTGTTITYYVYDDDQLIGEYSNATTALSEHIYLNGVPVGLMQNNNLYYVYVDHLNTPRAIADTSSNSVWTWENNDAFGNNQPNSVLSGFVYNLRFSGQYFDSENNLAYNYYRNYNSLTGRYMQSDPIGLNGGINTYGYVGGNPLSFNDPLGLDSWWKKDYNDYEISNSAVLDWLCSAQNEVKNSDSFLSIYNRLNMARDNGIRDPNLVAAERYMQSYYSNNELFSSSLSLLQHVLKSTREINFSLKITNQEKTLVDITVKPGEDILGKNGSPLKFSSFTAKWGFKGGLDKFLNRPIGGVANVCSCK